MTRVLLLSCVLAALILPAFASAAGEFPVTQMAPAQSTNLAPGSTPLFRVTSPCAGQLVSVTVANQDIRDGEGRLAASVQVDGFQLSETGQATGVYEATARAAWLQAPGTYFWQASSVANCSDSSGPTAPLVSPVVAIIVSAPTSASGDVSPTTVDDNSEILTLAQAKSALPSVITKGTRRTGRRISGRCTRRGSGSILVVFCTTRWTDGKRYTYNGSVRQALNDDGTISARFDGRRAKLSCLKKTARKVDEKRCYRKYRFTAEI